MKNEKEKKQNERKQVSLDEKKTCHFQVVAADNTALEVMFNIMDKRNTNASSQASFRKSLNRYKYD